MIISLVVVFCAAFLLILTGLSPTELRCSGPDWYEFGEFCYKPFSDKRTWHDARDTCRTLGADLVSILSMTEQSWLESYLYMGMDYGKRAKGFDPSCLLLAYLI